MTPEAKKLFESRRRQNLGKTEEELEKEMNALQETEGWRIGNAIIEWYETGINIYNLDWQSLYNFYMKSPRWESKRLNILKRDNFICKYENCTRKATQVHHLTYDRLGDELPEDLLSICAKCHHQIHRGDVVSISELMPHLIKKTTLCSRRRNQNKKS